MDSTTFIQNVTKTISQTPPNLTDVTDSPTNQQLPRNDQSPLLVAVDVINKYLFPISLLIGVVLNVMVVLLMRRPAIKKSNFSVYITALALSDTANLLCYVFIMYPSLVFRVDFRTLSDASCRIFRYCVKISISYSSWMVCIIALERVAVIVAPFKSKQYVNKKNALRITVGFFVILMILMNPYLWMTKLIDGLYCMVIPQFTYFDITFGRWIEAAVFQYAPSCVVVICNAILLTNLMIIHKKRAAMTHNTSKDKQDNFAVTAVTICFAYLAFALPNSIFYVLFIQKQWYINATPTIQLVQATLNLIGTFNYSSNLILYILSSRTLRNTFFGMICFCRRLQGMEKKANSRPSPGQRSGHCSTVDPPMFDLGTKATRDNINRLPE